MRAIQTKCLPATNFKPFRYKAWIEQGQQITLTQCSNIEHIDNHARVAKALASKLNWIGEFKGGCLPNGDYCWLLMTAKHVDTFEVTA